ncbi:PucR family transcriptional regulator [Paenibacillus agricola]|uniref:PucR family transcriptional regulator n=1 Tax=Paenibacillus agricola TaxID=2716264 RepID=A0ABX0J4L3_9BACL|nr:PucR family transcriptional regulator [Paenibacillus agricola]NHN30588.1 PucR family transcriptional regulator [Paenibacillus agricola]
MNIDQLTIQDLLKRPLFHQAKLIAGHNGILRSVGWIHILEITSAMPYANKHDLILTTGLGIHQFSEQRRMYLQELIHLQAAGLCVELGHYFKSLPQDMVDLANEYHFPLIVFESPVRFVDITQDIHALLINKQYQILQNLELFSRKLQQLSLESTNIQAILKLLNEHTSLQVIYYSIVDKPSFAPSVSSAIAKKLVRQYQLELELPSSSSATSENTVFKLTAKKTILSQPVICLGQTLSFVGIVLNDQEPTEDQVLLLDYVGKAIAHILLRKLFLEQKTTESHSQLIHDILQHKVVNEEQALARIGLRRQNNGKYWFLAGIIEIEQPLSVQDEEEFEARNQDFLVLLRSLLSNNGIYNLLLAQNNQIHLLCVKESFASVLPINIFKEPLLKTLEQLRNTVFQNVARPLRIVTGFGSMKRRLVDASASFKEAFDTLSVSQSLSSKPLSPFYEDLGIYQIFKGMADLQQLDSFANYHLGSVLAYDQQYHSSLLETLETFLLCMGAKQETAERLFIHRQTLYHRLDKLKELLGEDYLQPAKRLCLEVALHAYKLNPRP